ncbi:hypothetical protein [Bordetella bronchiseptica]|uniref:hypothetical protein n=1 Tax=Bordetella bronchiseptica TaxID=518 RepID=UPI0004A11D58|nr:hypothetical protein [Bordetella bronchiseptica]KDB69724.1 hypothetical protein AZ21_3792 [Bordetella bronchiseptica B20-10725633]KDB70736.1 hypothetical protein AZ21_1764 [Bordetella bronchiseptica B20-10725633]KDB73072.1 hypothetical protein AZ21_2216 [Bordetella bronchiseptica B20-10725633]
MMHGTVKDEIARLRAEARHFRDLAKMKRAEVAVLKAQPVGRRDQLAILQAQCRVGEYVRDAQNCEAKIAEWRLQLLPAAQQGQGGEV